MKSFFFCASFFLNNFFTHLKNSVKILFFMASTSGSAGSFDFSTDIDGYDMGDGSYHILPETEPEQENEEELADENQEITIEKSKKKKSVAHLNFTLNKQNNTSYSCIHCG
jgi:hypothetical protein